MLRLLALFGLLDIRAKRNGLPRPPRIDRRTYFGSNLDLDWIRLLWGGHVERRIVACVGFGVFGLVAISGGTSQHPPRVPEELADHRHEVR